MSPKVPSLLTPSFLGLWFMDSLGSGSVPVSVLISVRFSSGSRSDIRPVSCAITGWEPLGFGVLLFFNDLGLPPSFPFWRALASRSI